MKKTLVALAAVAATAAYADVTVYGNVDGGLIIANNQTVSAGNGGGTGSVNAFAGGGGMTPTLWGVKGSEDLGGGLKSIYTLEGSFNTGTGSSTTNVNSNGGLFGREANVGLTGSFGTVKAGLQFDPAVVSYLVTDPRGFSQFGSGLQGWINQGLNAGSSTTANSLVNIFDQNMISYSYAANGFSGTLGYSVGGQAGAAGASNVTSLGLIYENGPLAVSGGYFADSDSTNTNKATGINVGASYKFGDWKLAANYNDMTPNSTAKAGGAFETSQVGAGVTYMATKAASVYLAYYNLSQQANGYAVQSASISKIVAGVDYSLSKSTGLYAALTSASSGSASAYSAILDQSGVATVAAGQNVVAWTFGLHKAF